MENSTEEEEEPEKGASVEGEKSGLVEIDVGTVEVASIHGYRSDIIFRLLRSSVTQATSNLFRRLSRRRESGCCGPKPFHLA